MSKRKELLNQTFGSWLVVGYNNSRGGWNLKCKCGNVGFAKSYQLTSGESTRCTKCRNTVVGEKNSTHRLTGTKLYGVWNGMKQRCNNPNAEKYYIYGARGIRVCDEWANDFQAFYEWAVSAGYHEGLSIDRIDVNGNYEPNNCRWTGLKAQANNTRKNHKVTFNNVTHTLAEWSEITGIDQPTIRFRLKKGWSVERALTEKPFVGKNQTYKAG